MRTTMLISAVLVAAALAGCNANNDDSASSTPSNPVRTHAKNVIILINDGASWGTWDATSYWEYGALGRQAYDSFPVKLGMSTFPMNTSNTPTNNNKQLQGYDMAQAWDTTATPEPALPFAGYNYLKANYTDSAAAGTALASGIKTYNNAINMNNFGQAVPFITQYAQRLGKATGVVTTVPFPHATPAAFAAQNLSRNNYAAIANQMLTSGDVDLIMGVGAPGFTRNGSPCDAQKTGEDPWDCGSGLYQYMAQADWDALSAGTLKPAGASKAWQMIRSKEDFEKLANGTLTIDGPLFGSPQVAQTIQQGRQAAVLGEDLANPSKIKFVSTVPTLETMTRGAIRQLSKDQDGFFLMVEGGATDWANHTSGSDAPQYGQAIEETQDFNHTVKAVVDWVEKNSNWNETLVIVTTDHGNGMLMGPNADTVPYEAIANNGAGKLPGMSYRKTGGHSNELVRLWAKGFGADQFNQLIRGKDANFAKYVKQNNDGDYVDNTDVFAVMWAAMTGSPVRKANKP